MNKGFSLLEVLLALFLITTLALVLLDKQVQIQQILIQQRLHRDKQITADTQAEINLAKARVTP